jgi:hypothetical protein
MLTMIQFFLETRSLFTKTHFHEAQNPFFTGIFAPHLLGYELLPHWLWLPHVKIEPNKHQTRAPKLKHFRNLASAPFFSTPQLLTFPQKIRDRIRLFGVGKVPPFGSSCFEAFGDHQGL